jgi:serine protease DegS
LIDTRGNLIGINTAILSSDGSWQGIGFATPTSVAKAVMHDLIEHGRVIRGWLGVTVQDITPNLATTFGLEEARGGLVSEVVRTSPAYQGGLRPGDVLVGVNGNAIRDGYESMNIIAGTKPGTELVLNVIRNREALDLTVIIGTRPPMLN